MRVFVILFALLAITGGNLAAARDDLMPPPNPAPRIPVEIHALEGSTSGPLTALQKTREAKVAAAAAAQPVVALGREVRGKGAPAEARQASRDAQEVEGKGQALDGERITVGGREIRLFGIVTPALTSSFGPQTRLSLDRMLSNSNVLCKITNNDADGHPVAFCGTVKVPDLSYEMLRQGWAMVDRRTLKGNTLSDVYEKAEQEAQTQNRGIFAPTPVAMAVPVSDPTKAVTVPVPQPVAVAQGDAPALPAPAREAETPPAETPATIPDIQTALQKFSVGKDSVPVTVAASGSQGFVERYQILLGAFVLMVAAGLFGFFMVWRETKILADRRRALAAALRGELMSARLICRTRARELLTAKKADIEPRHPGQLWPRVRSMVYQAHVSQLGLLGAELARQVASVYGQCADYAAYYQSNGIRTPIPQVVGETLSTLAEHMDTLMYGLQEVETTGRALIGDDIMAEEEARAAQENVRLALAAAHKRALPPPTITASAIKSKRVQSAAAAAEDDESDEDDAGAGEEAEEKPETNEAKSTRSPRVA